jgi:1-deoxy-D-xylulose-5-phosphate reductoisomerase
LRFAEVKRLEFEEPRYDVFPALNLARTAGEAGGLLPAVLNAANEIAVEAFVEGRIAFTEIWQLVRRAMENCSNLARPLLDDIVRADLQAREFVREAIATR